MASVKKVTQPSM